jgi:hypothetical protein
MAFQEIRFADADEFFADGNNVSATVEALTYLVHSDDDMGMAGPYTRLLEARMHDLEVLLRRSENPNARDMYARLLN